MIADSSGQNYLTISRPRVWRGLLLNFGPPRLEFKSLVFYHLRTSVESADQIKSFESLSFSRGRTSTAVLRTSFAFACIQVVSGIALDKGNSPQRTQRTQGGKMYERPYPTGTGGKEECGGARFLCKKVLRARRPCIMQHRGVSTALSFTMPIGATPSGPAPPPAKILYG
jgi:hypothetical protein